MVARQNLLQRLWAGLNPRLAKQSLRRRPVPVVAITGSVGKSTTTAFIAELLRVDRRIRATSGKNVGWPVSAEILGIEHTRHIPTMLAQLPVIVWRAFVRPPEVDGFVLEVGTGRPGQLAESLRAFTPTIAVYTAIGNAHLGNYPDFNALVEEKATLIAALPPSGVAILRYEDDILKTFPSRHRGRNVFYGFDSRADVWMTEPVMDGDVLRVTVTDREGRTPLAFAHLRQRPHLNAVMAAWAVGLELGVPRTQLKTSAEALMPLRGRGQTIRTGRGTLIIDDTHNASPAAVLAALEDLAVVGQGRRRVAVLGDIKEIGGISAQAHHDVGVAASSRTDVLVAVGEWAADIVRGFGGRNGQVFQFKTTEECLEQVDAWVRPGDVVLLKGSRSMNLQWVVRRLRERA